MHRILSLLSLALIVTACGGGGGGGGTAPLPAPSGLSYTSPVKATLNVALTGVTPTVTGTVSTWSVSPALPAGLSLNASTGEVGGTPTALSAQATYTIKAANATGSTTFGLALSVVHAAPSGFGYEDSKKTAITSTGIVATKGKAIDPIRPVITGVVDSYSVNPALPAGLFLDTVSGTVSGTPKAKQAIQAYTVSATNDGGVATFSLNVTVNDPPTTATGVFRTRVQGLSYTSGSLTGTTGADGTFDYTVGGTVTFKVGNVTLGTATAGPLLFPVDLVSAGTGTNRAVINIDRFLQMLDHDADVTNGIVIDSSVLAIAGGWGAVNFDQDATAFQNDATVTGIIAGVNAADSAHAHALPAATASQAHIKKVFQCAYAGGFIGEYTGNAAGDDHGRFGATVKPDGTIEAFGDTLATPAGVGFDSLDANAVVINQARTISIQDPDPPFPLNGNFLSPDTMEGSWNNNTAPTQSGTFSGSRMGPNFDVLAADPTTRHFAGNIELTRDPNEVATGIVVMDVGAAGTVTGFVYSFSDGKLETIAGTLAANAFTGTVGTSNATATLTPAGTAISGNPDTHPNADWLDGTFTPTGGASVSFFTDGCSLE